MDPFDSTLDTPISPARKSQYVDGTILAADLVLDFVSKGLRCAEAGTLICRLQDDSADLTLALAAGEQLALRIERVRLASTAKFHVFA